MKRNSLQYFAVQSDLNLKREKLRQELTRISKNNNAHYESQKFTERIVREQAMKSCIMFEVPVAESALFANIKKLGAVATSQIPIPWVNNLDR